MANLPFDIDNVKFIESAFHSVPNDAVPVVAAFRDIPDDGGGWRVFHPADSQVKRQIGMAAGEFNTYYCIASVAPNNPLSRRRDALRAVHVVVLDDVGTGKGAKKAPGAIPLVPSAIIETSADNFQYAYFLDKPEEDLLKAQHLIRTMSEEHGDAGGSMAGKLVRLPVGHNSKPSRLVNGQPFQVRLTAWQPHLRYSLIQIADAFKVDVTSIPDPVVYMDDGKRNLMGTALAATKDVIFEWLAESGYCDTNVDYSGHVNVKCPWADGHTDANVGARYSPYGEGGAYAYRRQFTCFHEHCKDRTSSEFLQWVKQAGGPDLNAKVIDRFLEQYVYIGEGPTVGNLAHPDHTYTLREFHEVHKNKFYFGGKGTQRIYYSQLWQAETDRLTADGVSWDPGRSRLFTLDGKSFLNTYVEPTTGIETKDESLLDPIFAHLHYMFADADDYEHILDFMAWTRCKPEIRLQHALLHIAPHEGTGRGWMASLMRALFMNKYVATGPPLTSMDKFNNYMYHSALVVFDEIHDKSAKFDVQNPIRTMITDRYQEVNIKHGFKGTMEVFANVMFFSNHFDAMSISGTDRRLWIVINEEKPRDSAVYDKLYALIENPVAVNQMYWFLLRRVLANPNAFDATAPATSSAAKDVMRGADDDNFSGIVRDVIDRLRIMGVNAIWKRHLRRLLRDEGMVSVDVEYEERRLRHVLRSMRVEEVYRGRVPDDAVKLMGGGSVKDPICALSDVVKMNDNKTWARLQAMKTLKMPEFGIGPAGVNVLPFKKD